MKNKILILNETSLPDSGLGQAIFDHLAERWDMEPILFGQSYSRLEKGLTRFASNVVNKWMPGKTIRQAAQSKILAAEEAEVLEKTQAGSATGGHRHFRPLGSGYVFNQAKKIVFGAIGIGYPQLFLFRFERMRR